ncbi:hypothetical protein [Specibacter sp. RAF43]|uniref:hypothetical protein n=1 Tax=Specibacter sp. RAF43 TaxID=3233057 RepID=UPI003F9C6E22
MLPSITIPPDAVDFAPYVSRAMASGADAILEEALSAAEGLIVVAGTPELTKAKSVWHNRVHQPF